MSHCGRRRMLNCDGTSHPLCLLPFMTLLAAAFLSPMACESRYMDPLQPTTTSAIEGETVTLKCQATILEGLEYTWTHNGHLIQNTNRVHQIGPNLLITNVNRSLDAGDYKCIATSLISGAREASPISTLNVIWIRNASVIRHQTTSAKHMNAIILKCIVDGSASAIVEWYKNAEIIDEHPNVIMDQQARKLIIIKPMNEDIGVYQCSAKNEAGIVFSQQSYELKPKDLTILDHSLGTILVSNDPKPTHVRCSYKQPKSLEREHFQNGLSNTDESFEIYKNLRHDSKGLYLCRGKRGGGGGGGAGSQKMQEFNSELIKEGPSNLMKSSTVKLLINENEAATLNCDLTKGAKKNPILIKWKKDDKLIKQVDINSPAMSPTDATSNTSMSREDSRISANRKNGSLSISSVILSDAGTYECFTFNEQDIPIGSKKTELKIIEQLKFVPPPTSKNLELGTIGKIHCKVQGTPVPQVKWIRQDDEMPDTVDDINGTLVFKNVTANDKGTYSCVATNSQGSINATISVNTVVAPRFIVAPEGIIQALEMGSAMVHCQATGDPKPTVQWDKDLQYISNNSSESTRIHILDNGTLHILEVHLDDEGRYGCTIGSSAGLKREEARLTVKPADDFASEDSSDGFMITRAVLITMSVAFAYIILVVGLMLWCRYRRQARKARLSLTNKDNLENGNGEIKLGEIEPCLPDKVKPKKLNGMAKADASQKSDDTAASTNSKVSKKSNFDQISLSRNSLFEMVQIGRGDFGDVFIGKIKANDAAKTLVDSENRKSKTSLDEINEIKEDSGEDDEYKQVLIKALNKSKDENVCIEFRRQIEMFRAISHRSVSKLYGLCRDKDPHYLVLEYTDWGDLKQFLIATNGTGSPLKDAAKSACTPLTPAQILAIAHQIARGMDSIYRARYIHKDLAARNCLITSNFIIKVSYPALNRDKYSKEYFKHKNGLVPLRWLAPECVQDDDYSTKSDVYAFGVVMWELFKRASQLPFEDLSNEEFLTHLMENKLNWQIAEETPNSLSNLLTSCWNTNVKERPSFSQLYAALGKCLQNEKSTDLKD